MEKIRANQTKLILGLLAGAILLFLVNVRLETVNISLFQMADTLLRGEQSPQQRILLYMRIPGALTTALVGVGLAVSGTAIQTVPGNSLVGPNITDVNVDTGSAVVLCGSLLPDMYGMLPLAVFAGAFITVIFVYFLARYTGSSKITLVLSGMAMNSLLNAATNTIYILNAGSLVRSSGFRIGGLSSINTPVLVPARIATVIAVAVTASLRNEMEVLFLGDASAKTLGLPVAVFWFLFLALAAVLTGASVNSAGLLGLVGLIMSHMVRVVAGDGRKYFIAASALLGALLVIGCDLAARMVLAPYELPMGIVLSFIGAPFFIWLLIHQRRRGSHD